MSSAEGNSTVFANVTRFMVDPAVMAAGFAGLTTPALILHLLICFVSIPNKPIDGNFKYYICNLSLIDIVFCLACMSQAFFLTNTYSGVFCKVAGFLSFYSYLSPIVALIPIILSRMIGLLAQQNYSRIFTKRNIWLSMLAADLLPILFIFPFGFGILGQWGRKPNKQHHLCQFVAFPATHALNLRLNAFLIQGTRIVFYAIIFGASIVTVWQLHKYQKIIANLRDRTKLQETRQLVIMVAIQALFPIVSHIPITVANWISAYHGRSFRPSIALQIVANFSYLLNPLADAVATLIVVKPYRRSVAALFTGLKQGRLTLTMTTVVLSAPEHNAAEVEACL